MKFGYFCNTTNWTHKPYDKLLDEGSNIRNKGIFFEKFLKKSLKKFVEYQR